MSKCPFLSSVDESISCFSECAFYEYEGNDEGCPFRSAKGQKKSFLKEILQFDFDKDEDEDELLENSFIKDYM